MSVLLINQGWTDNLGDIAIGEVMERELAEFSPITVEFAPIVMKKTKGVLPKIIGLYSLDNKYREWIDAKLQFMLGQLKSWSSEAVFSEFEKQI